MLSKGKEGDALYVALIDLKRMLAPLCYPLDKEIEEKAKSEATGFVSNLRTHVTAGHKLYPLPGKNECYVPL